MLANRPVRQPPPRSDPDELREVIVEALRRANGALVAESALKRMLPAPYCRDSKASLAAAMAALGEAGRIHRVRVGQAILNAAQEPQATLGRVVDRVLTEQGPLTQEALKLAVRQAVPGHERLLPGWIREALTTRRLFEHTPRAREKKKRVGLEPDVRRQLSKTLKALGQELAKASAIGVRPEQVLEVLAAELGVPVPQATGESGPPSSRARERDQSLVLSALEALTRECAPGALLSVRDLRARAGLDKMRFDAAVMALAHGGRAMVHHHDYPFSLSEAERDALVRDEHGTYYVGIALGGRA
ncbi:MAG: hypothetical protein JW940_28455 [Polyangiaceae bacterium]|nr:hypothetical protein [Polyangiaceae bacterium]